MGFVYRALDQNIDADVVIKIPRQAMMDDPEFAGRFTREIRSLVKLSHPHIVKVTDVGTCEGMPFAVMQYLPGGSLEDQRPAGPERTAFAMRSQEDLPLAHRGRRGARLHPRPGLRPPRRQAREHPLRRPRARVPERLRRGQGARLVRRTPAPSQTAMTGAGMVLGTPEYMAPELIMGEPFDGRVDQYALAVTVYELLCGRRPFEDGTKTKVLVLHTSKAPLSPDRVVPDAAGAALAGCAQGLGQGPRRPLRNVASSWPKPSPPRPRVPLRKMTACA